MKKKCRPHFILILFFLLFGGLAFAADAVEPKKESVTVVTIQKADRTGNKKNELDGTDVIVLEGNVVVSVEKDKTTTVISADTINFNREKDMLYAVGAVKMEQTGGDTGDESVTADTLLFNTATLEGIFDGGRIVQTQSDSLNMPTDSTLIVASDIFGRDDSGTITFKNGALTFCDEDPPHWRIKATRIWLLPGDEFAFFNAFLYVGQIPVLYLPAFWYPKDELIFNPVFGYRQREGYFFQTTTYLFGRKPLSAYDVADQYSDSDDEDSETDDSYYSFVKPSKLKEQERQGLMLHNLKDDYKGDTTNYVKILADWYASLGYMLGIDGVIKPSNEYISNLNFNVELGFSNTIFEDSGIYTPYGSYTGDTYEDSSNFLGIKLPYRYKANLDLSVKKPLNLTLSMPLYSDPYFTDDFGERMETMDWIDYLISNPNQATEEDDDDDDDAEITSFTWNLSGSYTIPIADFLDPYVSTLSISSFSSSVIFSSLKNSLIANTSNSDNWDTYTPERKFFYPSQVTPLKISGKIGGTILSLGTTSKKKTSSAAALEVPLVVPEELSDADEKKADKVNETESPEDSEKVENKDKTDEKADESVLPESALPDLAFTLPAVQSIEDITYTLTYLISPVYTSEFAYSSTGLEQPEDFDWNRLKSTMVSIKVPTTLSSNLNIKGSFLGVADSFTFEPVYQNHPYISTDTTYGGYTESGVDSIKKTDYAARKLDLTNVNKVSLKPFYYTNHFKETGLAWNTTVKMVRTEFVGDADNPEWDYLTTDLTDEECLTVHTIDLTLAATQLDSAVGQKLVLSTTLPPQVDEYYGVLTFTFPYTTLTFETGVKQVSSTDDTWEKEPFKEALSVKMFDNKVSLTQAYTYELEDEYKDSLKYSLSVYDFQASYVAKYTYGYDFDSDKGWIARSEKEFLPYSLSLAYAQSSKKFRYWRDRIEWAPSLSSSIVYDFLRPTNSYFKFIPAITFKINKFLDIKFSASSRNDVIYRYVQNYFGPEATIAGETNWVQDLMDSFRFDDETKRKASGFKLESFNVALTHDMHDWDLTAEFEIEPRLVTPSTGAKYYDYSPYFTISVVWRPMSGMKTKIVDEYGDWELNP